MKDRPKCLMAALIAIFIVPATLFASPRAESDRLAVARAFVELMEQGYPGPEITDLAPWALAHPLALLEGQASTATEDDLRLRACLLLARRLRVERLKTRGRLDDGWERLAERGSDCAQHYSTIHANHAQFCAVAALESARGNLSAGRHGKLQERCAEPVVTISLWERAVESSLPDPPEPDAPDAVRSTFERHYQAALTAIWNSERAVANAQQLCKEKHDCTKCSKALRHLHLAGESDEVIALAKLLEEVAPAGVCGQMLATVAAWRQDWPEFERHLGKLAQPLPAWAGELELYHTLQRIAAGDPVTIPDLSRSFLENPQGELLRFAAEALARSAAAFLQPTKVPDATAWLVKASMRPEVVAAGEPALAAGLAFLWALASQETVFDFMDEALRQASDTVGDEVVTRVAIEILSVATRERNVERLQQALVLLRRVVNAERRRVPCNEAEFFLRFAEWLDMTMAGENEKALRRFQDRLNILRARLPKCASPRLRGLTVINLLAAAMARKGGMVRELGPYLNHLKTRNVTYHVLWVNQFLEQRQTARARAALKWCEAEAQVPEAMAACQLWRAYLHELVGEPGPADIARKKAKEILGDELDSISQGRILLLMEGVRRVGFALTPDGFLDYRATYTPAFFLVPLPRLATIPRVISP
jgi:hypothetical protein